MFERDRLGPNDGAPSLWRWTIDRSSGKVHEDQLDDRPVEFPRVDERRVGLTHRYGWGAGLQLDGDDVGFGANTMVRYDMQTGGSEAISFGPGRDTGAPAEGPVARVHLPARVPLGFHGNWIPTGS